MKFFKNKLVVFFLLIAFVVLGFWLFRNQNVFHRAESAKFQFVGLIDSVDGDQIVLRSSPDDTFSAKLTNRTIIKLFDINKQTYTEGKPEDIKKDQEVEAEISDSDNIIESLVVFVFTKKSTLGFIESLSNNNLSLRISEKQSFSGKVSNNTKITTFNEDGVEINVSVSALEKGRLVLVDQDDEEEILSIIIYPDTKGVSDER